MDNRYIDRVNGELKPFLEENGFTSRDDGSFRSSEKSVMVEYDETRQMYILKVAPFSDDAVGDYAEINAWLFDDSQNASDAVAVGIDFVNSMRRELGIKSKRNVSLDEIDLPSSARGSDTLDIGGFTKKVLDVYPQFKDEYKAHMAHYGKYLYLTFFTDTLVPQIKTVIDENNKKQVKKLYELLDSAYTQGNSETVNAAVAVLAAAAFKDAGKNERIAEMLADDKHFQTSFVNLAPYFEKSKKLVSTMVR